MHALLIAMVLTASPALKEAKSHLKAGRIDDVYFALEGKQLPPEEHKAAADVLAEAGWKALAKKDAVMALQLARMAEKHGKTHEGALEVAARASRTLKQFEDAEEYTDRWLNAAPDSAEGHLLRAELATEASEWQLALAHLELVKGPLAKSARCQELRKRAQKGHDEQSAGMSNLKDLEKQVARSQEEATKAPARKHQGGAPSKKVILYAPPTCDCDKAKSWFEEHGVAYAEEKDSKKIREIRTRLGPGADAMGDTAPIIQVGSDVMVGFEEKQIEDLLGLGSKAPSTRR
jgi:glutaredoxin